MRADKMQGQLLAWPAPQMAQRGDRAGIVSVVEVVSYLEAIAEALISGLSAAGKVVLKIDAGRRFTLPLQRVAPLGLIVGELVANSIKYAHPTGVVGLIKISASRRDGANIVTISDDGVGLPEGLDPLASEHPGFVRIRSLASRLGASLSYHNGGLGLNCSVSLPYAEVAFRAAKVS